MHTQLTACLRRFVVQSRTFQCSLDPDKRTILSMQVFPMS